MGLSKTRKTMAAYDDLNTNRILGVGIISIVVTAVSALAVQVVYYALLQWQHEHVIESSDYRRQNKVHATQAAEVSTYGVDPDTGNYTIPVEKSMELMLVKEKDSSPPENNEKKSDSDDA